jgi:hypothetical protein
MITTRNLMMTTIQILTMSIARLLLYAIYVHTTPPLIQKASINDHLDKTKGMLSIQSSQHVAQVAGDREAQRSRSDQLEAIPLSSQPRLFENLTERYRIQMRTKPTDPSIH